MLTIGKKLKLFIASGLICSFIFSSGFIFFDSTQPNQGEVKTITLEEAKEMAVKNSVDREKLEISRMKLSRDEDDTLTRANDAAFLVQAGISIEGKKIYNQVVDGLESIRMGLRSLEESRILQDQMIEYGAEVQYLMLLNQDLQLDLMGQNLARVERALATERVRVELGMATRHDLDNRSHDLYQLQLGIEQLKRNREKDEIKFKQTIGLPLDQAIQLESIDFAIEQTSLPNYSEGLSYALNNGLMIQNAKQDLQRKTNFRVNVQDRHAFGSTNFYKADLDQKEAELNLEDVMARTEESYRLAYRDLVSSRDNVGKTIRDLQLAQRDYELEKVRFDLGMTSKMTLDMREIDLQEKQLAKKQAEQQYLLAKTSYELARQGIIAGGMGR